MNAAGVKSGNISGPLFLGFLLSCLLLLIVLSAGMGHISISFEDVSRIIFAQVTGNKMMIETGELFSVIVMDVRLPRILTSVIVGGGLAISGCVFQGILLNPLADPYTLGVSAGAAFGASIALLLNISLYGNVSIPVFAFAGAVTSLFVVIYLSLSGGGISSSNLILSGIIVASILSAGISYIKYSADEQVAVIIFWLMGSFASRGWNDVCLTLIVSTAGFFVFCFFARDLNLLAMGRRTASSIGVDTNRLTLVMLITASLVTAICVSVSGIIGFVGLLVPHMMRTVAGPDNRRLIPASFLAGGILLLCADTLTRAILEHEVPVGVLTALIGGPFFCYIFRKKQMGRTSV